VRFPLLDRIRRRRSERASSPAPVLRRAPSPGALRRERRAILKAREERIRDLGGLTLEMYRRSTFRDELLIEGCREIVALEERINDLDAMLSSVASARRAPTTCQCGAPVPWGSHFCANCGRPVGDQPVISCDECGHPLQADAKFCAGCGRAADPAERQQQNEEPVAAASAAPSEQPVQGADAWER
jgi:hypothetical protein